LIIELKRLLIDYQTPADRLPNARQTPHTAAKIGILPLVRFFDKIGARWD